jgi:ABC-2 type transport system ATP-binding protein
MVEAAIRIEEVRKVYRGGIEALSGIAIEVPRGSVFGLLGPNGAGKSTLVKILLTIIRPSACRGEMLGRPVGCKKVLGRIGYLPEHARFPEYLTGEQVIGYSAGLCGISRHETRRRTAALIGRVGMAGWEKRRLGTYSKGMRQRIGIAQALVNEPELVFLDEPSDGVDPEGRIEIRRIIEELKGEGKTVFVNSHLLAEVEQVADRVAILAQGRVIETGVMSELTEAGRSYEVRTQGPVPGGLRESLVAQGFKVGGDLVSVAGEDPARVQPVIDELRRAGVTIREVHEVRRSLEDLFLSAVRNHKAGK